MSKYKKYIVVLLLTVSLLFILITYFFIQKEKSNMQVSNRYILSNEYNPYGTFDENDLLFNKLKFTIQNKNIEIPQISGLKNEKVERKINEDICNKIYTKLNECEDLKYAQISIESNFSNVFSIGLYYIDDYVDYYMYLNYNLINGEYIKFEDLFTDDANITDIVRKSFYDAMSKTYFYDKGNKWNNMKNWEEGSLAYPNEDKLYEAVNGFMNEENKIFYFTSNNITIKYKDYVADIKMQDIEENIAIYDRFKTDKSLFIQNDIGRKNMFYFSVVNQFRNFEKLEFGLVEDNMWYEISPSPSNIANIIDQIPDYIYEKYSQYEDTFYKDILNDIEKYREIAKRNKDKFYIFLARPSCRLYINSKYENKKWIYYYSNLVFTSTNADIYEIPMDVYEEIYKQKLIEAYRYEYYSIYGGAKFEIQICEEDGTKKDDDRIIKTKLENSKLVNCVTKEEYIKAEDIFYTDSNYDKYINERINEELLNKDFPMEDITEFINTKECKLDTTDLSLKITSSLFENIEINITIDSIDKELNLLNIYNY